eukprot:Hpha_TRINITY_DN10728_c0_g1::TRINITY_DN10728_c0_g1_i1::g.43639::m.43639/K12272/SRPRB, SRP102; signal recognition particle receptor subunit beta
MLESLMNATIDIAGHEGAMALSVGFVSTLLVIILSTFYMFFSGSSRKRNRVLLVGLPSAGKTGLFYRLTTGSFVASHTSMLVNETDVDLGGRSVHLVDYPGHGRLREGLREQLSGLLAVLFVVDAGDIDQTVSDNAAFIVDLLTNPELVMQKQAPALAIVCTKRDLGHSYKSTAVKRRLEREIDEVRKTKASAVGQMGESGGRQQISLGLASERFEFEKHSSLPTTFIDCASKEAGETGFFTGVETELKQYLLTVK